MRFLLILLGLVASAEAHEPDTCLTALRVRIDKGETLRGPIYSVIQPDRTETFTLTEGVELKGPMVIVMCDGHLTITKP